MLDIENEYFKERNAKAEALRASGVEPWAYAYERTHALTQVTADWGKLEQGQTSPSDVRVAGRLVQIRGQGKASFCHLSDLSGKLQVYFRQDVLGEAAYQGIFKRLDLGDIVGVAGPVFRTRTNELTVEAKELTLLAKALLPPPDKWHGLKDTELRYRQRYLDLMANEGARATFMKRAKLVARLRAFFEERGFLEVETPILQPLAGGAAARPFKTHHNTLGMDLFLRIAPELYLKRLLVGGFEKVFELNRNFRNEGISIKHNPEFTMVEAYQAYVDGEAMMRLTEELVADLAKTVAGGPKVAYQGVELDLAPPYRRLPMAEAVKEALGREPQGLSEPELRKLLPDLAPARLAAMGPGARMEALFGALVEPKLIQPTFVTDYPLEISPLAKPKPGSPGLADRFELFIYGREIANGFSELNDPLDQHRRFTEQLQAKEKGDEEAHGMDEDYVRALLHGMPPAGGLGLGVDRLAMLLTDSASIRDVILFPHLRPQADGGAS